MSDLGTTSSYCQVMVEGAPLDALVQNYLHSVEVDSSMFLPSQFKLVFQGPPDEILEVGGLQLAVMVTVGVVSNGDPQILITGEITSVEIEGDALGVATVVRGMDRSHRLMRGTKTMGYPEALASAVVTTLLGEAEVPPGEIEPTTTVYPVLSQMNVSAWDLIQQLAKLENYVAYGDNLGLFHFKAMPKPEEGAPPAMSYEIPPEGTQLVMGSNLRHFRAVVTSTEQIPAVTVTGYDPTMTEPLVGLAPSLPSTSVLLDPATEPAVVGGEMGGEAYFDASRPFGSQGAAETYAKSIAAELAGSLVEIEAECDGNASLLAGQVISLGLTGQPFEGNFVCTNARHVINSSDIGWVTWVTVGGYRDRSTFALASGRPANMNPQTINGVVVGKVLDVEDPLELGRVKLQFPWLDPEYISDWARMVQIGASDGGTGFQWFPAVEDEVLVAFDHGNVDFPYVIGNVYNGINKPLPPPEFAPTPVARRIISGLGHSIVFNDSPAGSTGIVIGVTEVEEPPLAIKLDAEQMEISITAEGQISITAAGPISIKSEASLSISAPDISIGDEETASVSIGGDSISIGSLAEAVTVGGAATESVAVSGLAISLGAG